MNLIANFLNGLAFGLGTCLFVLALGLFMKASTRDEKAAQRRREQHDDLMAGILQRQTFAHEAKARALARIAAAMEKGTK